MDLEFNRREKIVGLFIIVIAVLLLSTVVIIGRGQDWFKKNVTFYTTFDEAYNLKAGAAVKLHKADIGKVKKISIVENKVRVRLDVFEEYAGMIKKDSIATVESPTFIGDEYISITPGRIIVSPAEPGSDIRSMEKKSLADLLNDFQVEKTSKMLVEAIQDIAEIVKIIRDPQGPLFSTMDSIEMIMVDIHDKLDKVDKILENINQASVKAPDSMGYVQDSLKSLRTIFRDIEKSVTMLNKTLTNVEKGSQDIPDVMKSVQRRISEGRDLMEDVDKVLKSLQKNFLIKPNLPPEPEEEPIDAVLRK